MNIFSKKETHISSNPRQFDEVKGELFDRFTAFRVERNRAHLLNLLLVLIILILVSSIRYMQPLEKITPYTIKESIDGQFKADFNSFKAYNPEDVVIEKQARIFSKSLYTILSYRDAVDNLEQAKSLCVGKAINQFAQWFQEEKPTLKVKDNPDLTRTVEITSSSIMPNNVVIVRFKTKLALKDEKPEEVHLILTAKYLVSQRQSRQEAMENPTGIFFEHFTIDKEM